MLQKVLLFVVLFRCLGLTAQEHESLYKSSTFATTLDTLYLEKTSINASYFEIKDANQNTIAPHFYAVDFTKAAVFLTEKLRAQTDSVTVYYLLYPDFLTKEYGTYNSNQIISNDAVTGTLYEIEPPKNILTPFDGLTTSGSISRGLTIGNNQNSVVNSNLDLQITGKISDKVSLRTSLQDSNIPLQDGGYSQKLDQFDNIFMELFTDSWSIRAGDIFLENNSSSFLRFTKKVQGLALNVDWETEKSKTNAFASASLVRGQYAKSDFVGQEGNQGPYKLIGQNGELYVLVVSGSERVYVNGTLLTRGENNQYTIDYNAGEITFTSLFTITSEMRISVEYQYSQQNYTRFVTYNGVKHTTGKWNFGSYLYSENDLKNQPLQQNLTLEQTAILAQAGDNPDLMIAPSAYEETYTENAVLYKKTIQDGQEIFEYSDDTAQVLYNVKFSLVGTGFGNYVLQSNTTVNRIYEYIAPIDGISQGNYAPVIKLIAPIKKQVATFFGGYQSAEKTDINFELGVSNNDLNLYSNLDDANNTGLAGNIRSKHRFFTGKWNLDAYANYQFVQENFQSVERLYTIEFSRDWNISTLLSGNQSLLNSGLQFAWLPSATVSAHFNYSFEKLDLGTYYNGNRHSVWGNFQSKHWYFDTKGSYLKSRGEPNNSQFLRNNSKLQYQWNKNWISSKIRNEDNQQKNNITQTVTPLSQRFSEYSFFAGRGDSTKVFVELGYLNRVNDSVQNNILQRVNRSNSWQIKSRILQTSKSDLSVYAHYRTLHYEETNQPSVSSLNSRVLYNDRWFNQLLLSTTLYETTSGTLPQQEFTYVEVPVGQGVYTWIDYNGNGTQELEEFEVAAFQDQAQYIRVFLPNRVYIKTNQNKFSQSLTFNPSQWQNKTGFQKILSHFYNQTALLLERKVKNDGSKFELNPFDLDAENALGLNSSIRNSLFYNRGKQNHSVTYTYLQNQTKSLLNIGSQATKNSSHQLQYNHLLQKTWLLGFFTKSIFTTLESADFVDKNYRINGYQLAPKVSYVFSKSSSLDFFYEHTQKNNQIGAFETLQQHRLGTSFSYAGTKKVTLNGEFSLYENKFKGNELSAVGFQMLEGLQAGQNLVWRCLIQKNITQFLDVNVNYQGRKAATSNTIHTGSVQLRAYF
ncbi:hypothetical protein [Flavobacterium agrisoli]|uniref:Outer membrane beta-barrel protein n=1 Tax=Flavobacterium agrisoli TaxID=2793066 RepID=A0A934PQ96_9FLAO|nr:hypothetical protein [Flavobacterium agrisoli]MBK0371090.1 hypothetical protein [Flavobacterium agrisoli]